MTPRHDSVSTFARSVVGGAVLFGMLFAPETPEDRRRREVRAAMFHQGPTFWRGWPHSRPVDDACSDWLAVFLGVAGLAFLAVIVIHGFWSLSQ